MRAAKIDQTAEYPQDLHRLFVEHGVMRSIATPGQEPHRFLLRAMMIEEIAYASAAAWASIKLWGNPVMAFASRR